MGLNIDTLKRYARDGQNVLMEGRHGIGKTALITQVFNDVFGPHNEKWMYFSAATMDPWVDFVGIPKDKIREDGVEVLRIIPPEALAADSQIEAMFFDEYNRGDEKTLNAIMELIQFKSINGRKFPKLKCIWAAINPIDDDVHAYQVRDIDPAQKDRFEIQIRIPYELDEKYFTMKYGADMFNVVSTWWKKSENKDKVSPRKLDQICNSFMLGYDINDCSTNISLNELKKALETISSFEKFRVAARSGDVQRIKDTFKLHVIRENEVLFASQDKKKEVLNLIYPHMPEEVQSYITKTFKFKYKPAGSNTGLSAAQMEHITKMRNGDKPDFTYGNVAEIKANIKDMVKLFTVDNILNEETFDPSDIAAMFPFKFDSDEYKKHDGGERYDLAKSIASESDHDTFASFYTLCVAMATHVVKENGFDALEGTDLFDFLSGMVRSDQQCNTSVYRISVTEEQRILDALKKSDIDYLEKSIEEHENMFYS